MHCYELTSKSYLTVWNTYPVAFVHVVVAEWLPYQPAEKIIFGNENKFSNKT